MDYKRLANSLELRNRYEKKRWIAIALTDECMNQACALSNVSALSNAGNYGNIRIEYDEFYRYLIQVEVYIISYCYLSHKYLAEVNGFN